MSILTFEPILKQTIWGGDRIKSLKRINTPLTNIGESWEVSGVEHNGSVVANGQYKGRTLNDLVADMKGELVGRDNYERYGDTFPLLVKFIDAQQDLSIQVHPNDEQAMAMGLERGKTEMWYIMDSAPTAKLRCGLRKPLCPNEYKRMVDDGSICDALGEYQVKEGDCFFIPAGRIHSIGAGCFLAEIQETSDVTYRIYDYKRKDKNGNYRQLHTEQAAEVIDYSEAGDCRIDYATVSNKRANLVSCEHFCTSLYNTTDKLTLDYSRLDCFVILICMKGNGHLTDGSGHTAEFKAGTTVLLPAWTNTIDVEGNVKFLDTYI